MRWKIYKSFGAALMLILFLGSVACRDLFHLIRETEENVCHENNADLPHFHHAETCSLCNADFSAGQVIEAYAPGSIQFSFTITEEIVKVRFNILTLFQNPDTRGSPVFA
ncbi:MAG: hypothetical protein ACHQFW_04050 [Chitinophagales bacterium]